MTKIFGLIKNEWIKELSKVATWVMIILLAALTVLSAFSSLFYTVDSWISYENDFVVFCEGEIAWFEEMLLTGKGDEESLTYYRVQIEAYRIMLDAGMDWEDWRYYQGLADAAAEAKYSGDGETYDRLLGVIRSNDPKEYFKWKREGYLLTYAGDAERCAIYSDAMDFCIANGVIPNGEADWRYAQILLLIEGRETVLVQERLQESGGAWSESTLENARNSVAVAQYRLENGIRINPADSFTGEDWTTYLFFGYAVNTRETETSLYWNAMESSVQLLTVVSVLTVVLAGGTVANEFSAGTVKLLLMSPVRRWKILLSKYLTVLSFGLGLCALVGILSTVSALPLGAADTVIPAVLARGGEVYTVSPYLLVLKDYGFSFLRLVVMATMAFALSALTRKSSIAIALTVFLDLSGTVLAYMLYGAGLDLGRYLLVSNLDLAAIIEGSAIFPHQSLTDAIVCIALHMAVFLLVAHDAFVRREV